MSANVAPVLQLAQAIYPVLRARVPAPSPELSYTDLVAQLPNRWNSLDPDSDLLSAALGELVLACRTAKVPAIAAMVINHKSKIPGQGYFTVAHPSVAHDPVLRAIEWGKEMLGVRITQYKPAWP